jgi:hypothetical protein
VVVFGKGGKTRAVLLSCETWRELQTLRGSAGPEDPVFRSRKGGALDRSQALRIVKAAANRKYYGFSCPATDIDLAVVHQATQQVTALIEYKHYKHRKHPKAYKGFVNGAIVDLADRAGIPCFGMRYWPSKWGYEPHPANSYARTYISTPTRLPEQEYIHLLYKLVGKDLADLLRLQSPTRPHYEDVPVSEVPLWVQQMTEQIYSNTELLNTERAPTGVMTILLHGTPSMAYHAQLQGYASYYSSIARSAVQR